MVPKHIPAWKKLGLKLKYAKEETEDDGEPLNDIVKGRKRGASATDSSGGKSSDPASKRRAKKSGQRPGSLSPTLGDERTSHARLTTTPAPKQKSVSFTPETKSKDGDSVKQLYRKWVASQATSDPSFDPSKLSPALKIVASQPATSSIGPILAQESPDSKSDPARAPKKERKKKKVNPKTHDQAHATSDPSSEISGEEPAYLTYLKTYHNSPKDWKFSTPLQSRLLKSLFRLYRLPPEHDPAILNYLQGLKGSAARSRLRKQAHAIREEDGKWLDSNEGMEGITAETDEQNRARKRRDYEAAVARMQVMSKAREDAREDCEWNLGGGREEWEAKLRQRRRAEIVLRALGGEEEVHAPMQASQARPTVQTKGVAVGKKTVFADENSTQANGLSAINGTNISRRSNGVKREGASNGKKPRKRKRRTTGVPDDDSSDSESSSSSGEEREKTAEQSMIVTREKETATADMSSSSSDSNSSSDDD